MMGSLWHQWVGSYTGVVLLTVAALPVVLLTVPVLARWRVARGSSPIWAWRASLTELGMVYGTVPGVWMTMLPGSRFGEATGAVSLVPLRDLATMPTYQVVGNLLIFAAFGFLAPLRFAGLSSVLRVTALAAGGSTLIETAQYVLRLDRVSSVDDVLLNATGAGLAAAVTLASMGLWTAVRQGLRRDQPSVGVDGRLGRRAFVDGEQLVGLDHGAPADEE